MDKMINVDRIITKLDEQRTFAKRTGKNNAYCKALRDAIKIILAESIMQNVENNNSIEGENNDNKIDS